MPRAPFIALTQLFWMNDDFPYVNWIPESLIVNFQLSFIGNFRIYSDTWATGEMNYSKYVQ